MNYRVTYMDKRGGWWSRSFSTERSLRAFVERMRTAAIIWRDDTKIGEVWRASGEVDDRRVKWLWSFESEAMQ